MNNNIVIRLNSGDAYSNEDLTTLTNYDGDYDHRLTYYFKNPIVLTDEYELSIHSFTTNKIRTGATIEYPLDYFGIETFNNYDTSTYDILHDTYNADVIEETIQNVRISGYSDQSQTFFDTDAYVTVKIVKNQNNSNGVIEIVAIETRGTNFVLNDTCFIAKSQITAPTTLYNSFSPAYPYANFYITSINGASEILDVSLAPNGNNVILSYQAGQQITEGTFENITFYEDDGAGWYRDSGVVGTVSVVRTTGTNYGTIVVDEITNGGTGFSINDVIYIDKFELVENNPPNTYSASARFAAFAVTELVNGIGELTPYVAISNEIIPNERALPFVEEVINDVPFLRLVNGNYIDSGARGDVNVFKNTNDPNGGATLLNITNKGSGFTLNEIIYIDKEFLTQNNNTYNPAERYIEFAVASLTDSSNQRDVEIKTITNYGFNFTPDGFYYWQDPYSSLKINLELFTPPGFSRQARIISIEGVRYDFVAGSEFEIPSSQVVEVSTGTVGWNKTLASGNLTLNILSVSPLEYDKIVYKVALENVLYNNMFYKNTDNDGHPVILLTDVSKSTIDLYNQVLTLSPQIISELKVLVKQPILTGEKIDIAIILQKKNNIYN